MLEVIEIFRELKNLGIHIELCEDQLKINGTEDKLTNDLIAKIKNNKIEIIAFLKGTQKDNGYAPIHKANADLEYYPTSSEQKRLYFLQQLDEGNTAYNMPSVFRLRGNVDYDRLEYAVKQIIKKHEAFRTSFTIVGGVIFQRVLESVDFSIEYLEVKLENLDDVIQQFIQPFDLIKAPLIRVKLFKIRPDEHLLFIDIHHIIWDGVSWSTFRQDFRKAYQKEEIGNLVIQYKDYTVWEQSNKKDAISKQQETYWLNIFNGDIPALDFPTDYRRPEVRSFEGDQCNFELTEDMSMSLKVICERYSVTLYMLLLAIYNVLLSKYSNTEDIIVGTINSGRDHDDVKDIIGMFVNTLAIRSKPVGSKKFTDYLKEIRTATLGAFENQHFPFEELVSKLNLSRDTNRNPLFDTIFSLQNFERDMLEIDGLEIEIYQIKNNSCKFDLNLTAYESDTKILYIIEYYTKLFKVETVQRIGLHLSHIAKQVIENPERTLAEIGIVTDEEKDQILNAFNSTTALCRKDKTIHQLFQEQSERVPDNIALVYEDKQLSYRQLNERSSQLARHIRQNYQHITKQPLAPDKFIALYLDRSLEMVIGILAVLKAGGAYVPVDTKCPQKRVDYMLTDTQAELILSMRSMDKDNYAQLPQERVIYIDQTEEFYKKENKSNLSQQSKATDLAYVIYTSGTTGKPKGVMVEHHQVSSFAVDNNYINNEQAYIVAGISNYAFDGSIFDIFFPLLNGKRLALINGEHLLDLSLLDAQLIKLRVDTIFITTALFNSLVQNQTGCLAVLKQVLFGGETCSLEVVNRFKKYYKETTLVHVYGPTENIVYSTYCNLSEYDTENIAPIGTHLSDKKLYVLDGNLALVPIGVVGELYVGGVGLARGYLMCSDLTEERFISNPFASKVDMANGYVRFYKTGDLVRWLSDGNLEFVGRNDDQVKISGFRIELGEVEHALAQVSGIKQCCVLVKERKTEDVSSKYLIAYYVQDSVDGGLTQTTILEKLSRVLPEYMMPRALVAMDSLPLTANGKLDKRALPDPGFSLLREEYVAPNTEREKDMCEIWQEILGLNRVGVKDNFFRIGGDSILAIQLSHRMSKILTANIKVADVFKFKTIKGLLENIVLLKVDNENIELEF